MALQHGALSPRREKPGDGCLARTGRSSEDQDFALPGRHLPPILACRHAQACSRWAARAPLTPDLLSSRRGLRCVIGLRAAAHSENVLSAGEAERLVEPERVITRVC